MDYDASKQSFRTRHLAKHIKCTPRNILYLVWPLARLSPGQVVASSTLTELRPNGNPAAVWDIID